MEQEERKAELNEQFSHINDLNVRLSASDRAALEYVKSLSGFKKAYPDLAAEHDAVVAELSEAEIAVEEAIEWVDFIGSWLDAGKVVNHEGGRYEVVQGHIAQEHWRPESVPALYKSLGGGGQDDEWPAWKQPTGAQDAYNTGDKVSHIDKHWVSKIDANVWEPGAVGMESFWEEQ